MGVAILIILVLVLGMYFFSKSSKAPLAKPKTSVSNQRSASERSDKVIEAVSKGMSAEAMQEKTKADFQSFRDKFRAGFVSASDDMAPRYVFIDFETTDLPYEFILPEPKHMENFPYIVQAAILVFNQSRELITKYKAIIRPPDDAKFAGEAVRIHGLDRGKCKAEGVDISEMFAFFKAHASNKTTLIAHNMKFDNFMLRLEAKRHGVKLPRVKKFCTMKETTDLCRIYKDWGHIYKYPTLKELVYYTFTNSEKGSLQVNFHDALTDITLCAMCFFELKLHESLSMED